MFCIFNSTLYVFYEQNVSSFLKVEIFPVAGVFSGNVNNFLSIFRPFLIQ